MASNTSNTSTRDQFYFARVIRDSGLILPHRSILTKEEQRNIRRAIRIGKHVGTQANWSYQSETYRFTRCLTRLFSSCSLHRDKWNRVALMGFWGRAKKGAKWPQDMVTTTAIQKLALILFAAREEYKRQHQVPSQPQSQSQSQSLASSNTQHEVSDAIDRFYDGLSMQLGDGFSSALKDMLNFVA